MGQSVSIYLPSKLLEWIDDEAERENRSRSNFVEKVLSDLREGRLVRIGSESTEIRKARLPPSARVELTDRSRW